MNMQIDTLRIEEIKAKAAKILNKPWVGPDHIASDLAAIISCNRQIIYDNYSHQIRKVLVDKYIDTLAPAAGPMMDWAFKVVRQARLRIEPSVPVRMLDANDLGISLNREQTVYRNGNEVKVHDNYMPLDMAAALTFAGAKVIWGDLRSEMTLAFKWMGEPWKFTSKKMNFVLKDPSVSTKPWDSVYLYDTKVFVIKFDATDIVTLSV